MKLWALIVAITVSVAAQVSAQDLNGVWQGTVGAQQRVLIVKKTSNALRGEFYTLSEDRAVSPVSKITIEGNNVSFDLDYALGTFKGMLSSDGQSIAGTWQTRSTPQPLNLARASAKDLWVVDPSPHRAQFVQVEKGVKLEVLDWGGKGPAIVFLAGMGNSAHVFDALAPKFTDKHHVYGITRRGWGASSVPAPTDENYDADRLGDDVLAVIDALKLNSPVVVGHSIAGEELSSIGTRHPEKIGGLVYLEATSEYAFYNPLGSGLDVDSATLRRALAELAGRTTTSRALALVEEIQATSKRLQANLPAYGAMRGAFPDPPQIPPVVKQDLVIRAIKANVRKYGPVTVPMLALIAVPHQCAPHCEEPAFKMDAANSVVQADGIEAGIKSARVVRLEYADHYLWHTHEADVLKEMNAFLEGVAKTTRR